LQLIYFVLENGKFPGEIPITEIDCGFNVPNHLYSIQSPIVKF